MKRITLSLILAAVTLTAAACTSPEDRDTPRRVNITKVYDGRAVITSISDSSIDGQVKPDYSDIFFNFEPSDPASAKEYLCSGCSDLNKKLFYDNRESFHKNWVEKWGIKKGNIYNAKRHELHRGDNTSSVSYEVFLEPR